MFMDWFTIKNNGNRKLHTIASYAMKKFGIEYQGFYCIYVCTEINLIALSDPSNWVNRRDTCTLPGTTVQSAYVTYDKWGLMPPYPLNCFQVM